MFTGIITATGEVAGIESVGGDFRFRFVSRDMDFSDVSHGDSIAVSGVCLTVVALESRAFFADVSRETMQCTAMSKLQQGSLVNLEKAMLPTTRFGGHIVSGHVDGLAVLREKRSDGRSERLFYEVPAELSRYIARKGSVCLDGVSLTVNDVDSKGFDVNIIPHTAAATSIHTYQPGQQVNLEVDLISRYLERLLLGDEASVKSRLSLEFLQQHGFL